MNHVYSNDMPSRETLLTDYALGELGHGERADAERAEVERRLATDEEARHELEELGQLAAMLRAATLGGAGASVEGATVGGPAAMGPAIDGVAETVALVSASGDLRAAVLARLGVETSSPADGEAVAANDSQGAEPRVVRPPRSAEEVARRRSTIWAAAASIGVLVTGFGAMALVDHANPPRETAVALVDSSRSTARNELREAELHLSGEQLAEEITQKAERKLMPSVQTGPTGTASPYFLTPLTISPPSAVRGTGAQALNSAAVQGVPGEPEFVPYTNDLQLFDAPDLSKYRNASGWFGSAEYLSWSVQAGDRSGPGTVLSRNSGELPSLEGLSHRFGRNGLLEQFNEGYIGNGRGFGGGQFGGSNFGSGIGGGYGGMGGFGGGGFAGGLGGFGVVGNGYSVADTNLQNFSFYAGLGRDSAEAVRKKGAASLNLQSPIQEGQTRRFLLGAGVNSNSGLLGSIVVNDPNAPVGNTTLSLPQSNLVIDRPTSMRVDVGPVNVFTSSGVHFAAAVPEGTLGENLSTPGNYSDWDQVRMPQGSSYAEFHAFGPIIHSPTPAPGIAGNGTLTLNGASTFSGDTIVRGTAGSDFTSGGRFIAGGEQYGNFTGGTTLNGDTLGVGGSTPQVHAGLITGSGGLPPVATTGGRRGGLFVNGVDFGIVINRDASPQGEGAETGKRLPGVAAPDGGHQFRLEAMPESAQASAARTTNPATAKPGTPALNIRIDNRLHLPALAEASRVAAGYAPTPARSAVVEEKLETVRESLETVAKGEVAELAKLTEGRELVRIAAAKQQVYEGRIVPLLARERAARSMSAGDEVKVLEQKVLAAVSEIEDLDRLEETEAERVRLWREAEARSGSQFHTDAFDAITENPFVRSNDEPLSTFSIDVDTASYSIVRSIINGGQRPPRGAVRLEEFINYFPYDYPQPEGDDPFSVHTEAARCPWNADHVLLRVGLKGKEIHRQERPASNLVFLVDVSGSMDQPNKLPLVRESLHELTDQLGDSDQVSIVVYAGNTGLVLDCTGGNRKQLIHDAIDRMNAGGSTNGGAGIQLAYQTARRNFIKGGVNRVILATDGDFNVGVTSQAELIDLIEQEAKTSGVFFSALGYGMGNLKDSTLEKLADKGNGNYAYIDNILEARKVLVEQMSGTLVTIAKDVKIQIEFNPNRVAGYRLLGYENRMLAAQDFNDDKKDAGEIGAGHTVTALYELIPAGKGAKKETAKLPTVDPLKYQKPKDGLKPTAAAESDELLTLKLRYKQPDGEVSKLIERAVKDDVKDYGQASGDFKFAASVASFGMLLRRSAYRGTATFDAALELAQEGMGHDRFGYRAEFIELIRKAKQMAK